MKAKLLTLLLLLLPAYIFCQNYEKEGDELFVQAKYEQAEKKYKAAIAIFGDIPIIQQKFANSTKCKNLLSKAISAENESRYNDAAKYYSDLYAVHSLAKYQSKANTMKQKAKQAELAKVEKQAQKMRYTNLSTIEFLKNNDGTLYYPQHKVYVKKLRFDYNSMGSNQYCFITLKSDSDPNYMERFAIPGDQYGKAGNLNTLKAKCRYVDNNIYEYTITQVQDAYLYHIQKNVVTEAYEVLESQQNARTPKEQDKKYVNGHLAVDMGLSVKWADCNIGAGSPWECGDYFSWGETRTKSSFPWSSYKYMSGGKLTKYCTNSTSGTVDNRLVLEPQDDAAYINWGSSWRVPTKEQWEELADNNKCKWEWTNKNGVDGYKVTSNITGNSIFLPITGYKPAGTRIEHPELGLYWTSTLFTGQYDKGYLAAYRFDLGASHYNCRGTHRCNGRAIRAVCK